MGGGAGVENVSVISQKVLAIEYPSGADNLGERGSIPKIYYRKIKIQETVGWWAEEKQERKSSSSLPYLPRKKSNHKQSKATEDAANPIFAPKILAV